MSDANKKYHKTIGHYLKEQRLNKGFTQKDVSNHLGLKTSQFVSNWERGLISPPLSTIRQLIYLFDMDPHEVMKVIMKATEEKLNMEILTKKQRQSS